MGSEKLWKIVHYLKAHPTITPRQVKRLLGCDCRKANDLLNYLHQRGVVANVGKHRNPEYRLKHNGELKIQPLREKAEQASSCAQVNVITDICRQNWTGYQIHKIFERART